MPNRDFPSVSPVEAGWKCRCPRCGRGKLYSGLLTVRERCSICELDLRAHDTGDGPAVFVILILGAVVVPMALWLEVRAEPPLWLHAVVWPPAIVVLAVALLRPLKGFLIAQQYRHLGLGSGS
jgi:uncharacterized protein (DUF983 family)